MRSFKFKLFLYASCFLIIFTTSSLLADNHILKNIETDVGASGLIQVAGFLYTPAVDVSRHKTLCSVLNTSSKNVEIIGVELKDSNGSILVDGCKKTLSPGEACSTSQYEKGEPTGDKSYFLAYCKITVKGGNNKEFIRGALNGHFRNYNSNDNWAFYGRSEFVVEAH